MRPRPDRHAAAFTLVELLVVIAISSIMFVSLVTFTHSSVRMTGVLQDHNLASHTGRMALARFTREAALASIIAAAEEYKIAFTCTDITGDGADDAVMYAWDSASKVLVRTLNGVSETFAENVDLFSLEYQYETETEVTIASPGDVIGMTLGTFAGASDGTTEDLEIDVWYETWYVQQTFTNQLEVPAATSVTVRARANVIPPPVDMRISLDNLSTTLAYGWLYRSQLTTTFQDVTVPLTWIGGDGRTMEVGKTYRLRFRPGGYYPYAQNAGTLQYQKVTDGPGLGDGLTLSYWDGSGGYQTLGNMASLYFTLRGDLPITTPRRSTVPVSILKKIQATIRVTEGEQQTELVRTCKVVNQ